MEGRAANHASLAALAGAVLMRLADPTNFPTLGTAIWWALQTVTTVGYGDVVPTTTHGRMVGGADMVLGVSFIAFLTAAVTSSVIRHGDDDERRRTGRSTSTTPMPSSRRSPRSRRR